MNKITDALDDSRTAWKSLQREWGDIHPKWPDSVGDEFTRRFWQSYERQLPKYLRALENLATAYDETEIDE